MDNYGMLYFGLLRNHAICKWDSYRPFTLENQQVVAKDDTHIQWTDGECDWKNMGSWEIGFFKMRSLLDIREKISWSSKYYTSNKNIMKIRSVFAKIYNSIKTQKFDKNAEM